MFRFTTSSSPGINDHSGSLSIPISTYSYGTRNETANNACADDAIKDIDIKDDCKEAGTYLTKPIASAGGKKRRDQGGSVPATSTGTNDLHHYGVTYDATSPLRILTQCQGSHWKLTLPYCIATTTTTMTLYGLRAYVCYIILTYRQEDHVSRYSGHEQDPQSSDTIFGATIIHRLQQSQLQHDPSRSSSSSLYLLQSYLLLSTIVITLLLLARVIMSMYRYNNELCPAIHRMNHSCRQLIHTMVALSLQSSTSLGTATTVSAMDLHHQNKQWRNNVAYLTCVMLRTAIAIVEYNPSATPTSHGSTHHDTNAQKVMELPELGGGVLMDLSTNLPPPERWLHGERTWYEEQLRIPIRLAYLLRKAIHSRELPAQSTPQCMSNLQHESNLLYQHLDQFLYEGYYRIHQFLTTPVSFPWVQLSTVFLFIYLFTLPFVLFFITLFVDNGNNNHNSAEQSSLPCNRQLLIRDVCCNMVFVFILTYVCMALQFAALQFDSPGCFPHDDSIHPHLALAQTTFEDIYITIQDIDGDEWADNLRFKLHHHSEDPISTEQSYLLNSFV